MSNSLVRVQDGAVTPVSIILGAIFSVGIELYGEGGGNNPHPLKKGGLYPMEVLLCVCVSMYDEPKLTSEGN